MSHPLVHSPLPFDCQDVYQNGSKHNGVYTIYPTTADQPVSVYCDMGCTDDDAHESHEGQWTVILKRVDGTVNFYRPWDAYKEGFGNKDGEYWLGLETMYRLTWPSKYELRVDMEDWQGGSVFAQYTSFSVESEDDGYRLRLGNYVDGGAGDSLTYVNGYKFSTYDKDQDVWSYNCADTHKGGFWFNNCHRANPTGLFQKGINSQEGINWYYWKSGFISLKSMTMKIRRVTPPE
ncbi:microfibril-associated glycoprotein 4-like [Engraulis encrasicolus]|uniref:microfibril-associated glycoprotein 4-like n=1 Tax=Engraulis encrasicolus TaxID=184585 RepID=UPI002FD284D7